MIITDHAENRIRQRCGLPRRAVNKKAEVALRDGLSHKECTGRLKKYFDYLFLSHGGVGANIRIYGDNVYIFTRDKLITVLPLPNEHRKSARKILDRRKKSSLKENE
jgi:hypothetical protein